jgi:hypothetical protein
MARCTALTFSFTIRPGSRSSVFGGRRGGHPRGQCTSDGSYVFSDPVIMAPSPAISSSSFRVQLRESGRRRCDLVMGEVGRPVRTAARDRLRCRLPRRATRISAPQLASHFTAARPSAEDHLTSQPFSDLVDH